MKSSQKNLGTRIAPEPLLRPEEVAARLGLDSPPKDIPLYRLYRDEIRYRPEDIDQWLRGEPFEPVVKPEPEPPEPEPEKPDPGLRGPLAEWEMEDGFLYFVGDDYDSPVKVGWTRKGLYTRLGDLQVGNWRKLLVHHSEPAFRYEERLTHHLLRDHRLRGEWFERDPALELAGNLRNVLRELPLHGGKAA